MIHNLNGLKVACIITHGFEHDEMVLPTQALQKVGAKITLISLEQGPIKSWKNFNWHESFEVDTVIQKTSSNNYDALLLPGGTINADTLRINPHVVQFVKDFATLGKPIAAICHAPWILINAEAVKGRIVTSWPSLAKDLENAEATWIDKEVVRDGNIVTSRKPDDIPAFNSAMIELFAEK